MSRNPFASSNNDAESALSDDDLDGVVGGGAKCSHGFTASHTFTATTSTGTVTRTCSGPGTRDPSLD